MIEQILETLTEIENDLSNTHKKGFIPMRHSLYGHMFASGLSEVISAIRKSEIQRKANFHSKFCSDPKNTLPFFDIHIDRLKEIADLMIEVGRNQSLMNFVEHAEQIRRVIYKLNLGG